MRGKWGFYLFIYSFIFGGWVDGVGDFGGFLYKSTFKLDLSEFALNHLKLLDPFNWPAHRAGLLWSNFFGQPGSVSKFPQFLCVKLWVGWVGRGYIEISRYFPALWINRVTLVTKIKLWYSLGYQITFESPKMPLWYAFLRLQAWLNLCSIPFLPQQLLWLADYLS